MEDDPDNTSDIVYDTTPANVFHIIAAVDDKWGISREGRIPWADTEPGREDLKWFRSKTKDSIVIMGRKTHESIGRKLTRRVNIVIASSAVATADFTARTLQDALAIAYLQRDSDDTPVFVIGGAQVYAAALVHPDMCDMIITHITGDYKCDLFFPKTQRYQVANGGIRDDELHLCEGRGDVLTYRIKNPGESGYLSLLSNLLHESRRTNRTGVTTRGSFAQQLRFNLTSSGVPVLPLLTTKRVPFRLVATELIWFLRGSTDTAYLRENKCKIWDSNTTREFLDARGLTEYAVGETGPIYGYQWRNWNQPYPRGGASVDGSTCTSTRTPTGTTTGTTACTPTYTHTHRDQLARVINTLRTDPFDRRMIVSAWNPEQIDQMVLPPCHWSFQFYVTSDRRLNCLVNMRSADVALGVPFNIASYGLLTHLVAKITSLVPGELVVMMADCHIYTNHIPGILVQIERNPRLFPSITISDDILEIDDFTNVDQITISEYHPHDAISYEMAI